MSYFCQESTIMEVEELYPLYLNCDMQVCTDTRQIVKGAMFFALEGENFNGNLFAGKALESGAAYAITDEGDHTDTRVIKVDNALKMMQELALFHRSILKPRLIGIGGSNGKTSTKELIVSILSTQYNVHFTKGNLNNHIGVPLTLLQLRKAHQIAVIEMGANREGDISELCEIADPELGVITNIGKEHLEGFGSIEGVAKAEGELFDYLEDKDGHVFINADDPFLIAMANRFEHKSVYGKAYAQFTNLKTTPGISFIYRGEKVESVLMGQHNLQNIMAAVSVAEFFLISKENIAAGINRYNPQNNRSQWISTVKGNKVLMDAYNANPSSVEMALKTFADFEGKKIVLLGDMFELGSHEAAEHQSVISLCESLPFEYVFLLGEAFYKTESKAKNIFKFQSRSDMREAVINLKAENVLVLIKGSRGMKMEEFADCF